MGSIYKNLVLGNHKLIKSFLNIYIWIFLIIYLSPYFILGSNNFFYILDNLDSVFVEFKILLESGKLFSESNTIIEQPLGGIPRYAMPSQYNAIFLFYHLFGPEKTYVIVRVLATLVGFFGMKKLLNEHILEKKKRSNNYINNFLFIFNSSV